MTALARVVVRLAWIALAAALCAALTAAAASLIEPPQRNSRFRGIEARHRPREPQPGRVFGVAGEAVLIALIAAGGRLILRLRLED